MKLKQKKTLLNCLVVAVLIIAAFFSGYAVRGGITTNGSQEPLLSVEEATKLLQEDATIVEEMNGKEYLNIRYEGFDSSLNRYQFRLYETVSDGDDNVHTATSNWYYVDVLSGEVSSEF